MNQVQQSPQPEKVAFYSRSAHFSKQISKPRYVLNEDGQRVLTGGQSADFTPQGDGWGRYVTDDPGVIEVLSNTPGVYTAAQYNEETTPAETRIELERAEKSRVIAENNNLLELVRKQEAEIARLTAANAPKGQPSKAQQ